MLTGTELRFYRRIGNRRICRHHLPARHSTNVNGYLTNNPFGKMLNENSSQFNNSLQHRVIQTTEVSPGNFTLTGDYVEIISNGLAVYNKYGTFKVALNPDGSRNQTLTELYANSTIDPHNLYPVSEITAQSGNGYHNKNSQPNIGKKLSAQDIANLGGTGSGMPGGWEPQDEENARNNESYSLTNKRYLNSELISKEIAGGHAFDKHVLQQSEFTGIGIRTRAQFAQHIERVINNPTATKELSNGRLAYWDQSTGTVVIRNPKASDGGTAFRPVNGKVYFDNLR